MNSTSEFLARSLSSPEYILELHAPEDQVDIVLVNRLRCQMPQHIARTETFAKPGSQIGLRDQNRSGKDDR